MKILFNAIFTLFILIFINACAVIPRINWEDWGSSEISKLGEKYHGIYVLDKQLREEMIKREKEREEYHENYYKKANEEKEKFLQATFGKKRYSFVTREEEGFWKEFSKKIHI